MKTIYDSNFNKNEWFVLIALVTGLALIWKFRKRFSPREVLAYSLFSFFIGMIFDHSIGIGPFDYYDINDSSFYELMDSFTYLMYGAFGYFYIYFYDYLKIKPALTPVYILIWALISTVFELFAHYSGVFHYKNGYKIYYSFPLYLLVLILHIYIYKLLNRNKANN